MTHSLISHTSNCVRLHQGVRVPVLLESWDDIKRETEKRAKTRWADYDSDNSDTLCEPEPKSYSEAVLGASSATTEPVLGASSVLSKPAFLDNTEPALGEHEPKSYSEAVLGASSATTEPVLGASSHSVRVYPNIVPGDPIGIRSIQSIMMSATQMNLSHFHTAGMSSSIGHVRVPSAAEAMNSIYTKNNTSMKFTMHKSCMSTCKLSETFEQLRYLRKELVGASLGHFIRRIGSSITGLDDRENIWYSALPSNTPSPSSGSVSTEVWLRFYIDYNKMHNHGLTLEGLAQEVFGNDCQWNVSPDFMGMIDISFHPDTYISQWLSRAKNRVCGTSYVLSCNSDEDNTQKDTPCPSTFFTRGTNVLAACRVPGIDKTTLTLNNVISVEKNFGIEAAAHILAELTGNDSDTRVRVISDFMARTGTVLPFSKHSSEVSSKGLLTSMGFERPKDDIQKEIKRAMKSRSAELHVESVYEHIITGKDPPLGFRILT